MKNKSFIKKLKKIERELDKRYRNNPSLENERYLHLRNHVGLFLSTQEEKKGGKENGREKL